MPALLRLAPLLQIPLSEQIQDTLTRVQEAPFLAKVIPVCVVMMVVLGFLEKYFKALSSLLDHLLKIREQLLKLFTPPAAELDTQADRTKLLKAFSIKLEKRLTDVLGTDQLIALSYEDRPGEVGRYQRATPSLAAPPENSSAWQTRLQSLNPMRLLRRPEQAPVALAEAETMMAVFDRRDVAGRLLILGEPGAGKTTTRLELAQELVVRAETDDSAPVPIIFELSNWTQDSQAIGSWLVAQLKEEYNVAPKIAQHWIATHQILPLLDGLDELGGKRLPKCVEKLNAWLPDSEPDRRAVVCCRTKEFRQGEVKLTGLNGAVELQPLSDGQIQDYLASVNQPHLWADTIAPSKNLTDLARTPLMLTVMAVALANRPAKTSAELFAAYIDERFARYEAQHGTLPYSRRDTCQYLQRLASQLQIEYQASFLIEKMQPTWLITGWQRRMYNLIQGIEVGLILGLICDLAVAFNLIFLGEAFDFLGEAYVFTLICGLAVGLTNSEELILPIKLSKFFPVHFTLKLTLKHFFAVLSGIVWGFSCGLFFGLISGFSPTVFFDLITGLKVGLISGVSIGLIVSLILSLFFLGLKNEITTYMEPNEGIRASAKAGLLILVLGLFMSWFLNYFFDTLLSTIFPASDYVFLIVFVSTVTTISLLFFFGGGFACIQHFALRLVLWRSGAIPRDYAAFLKYTSELRLTRQTGGEFRFFHDLLREHFAQSPPPTP